MRPESVAEFATYLSEGERKSVPAGSATPVVAPGPNALRKLWESTDLAAGDFADAVARFYGLPRVSLQHLMAATPLAKRFSPRFLREMTVFPYRAADGSASLAVGDPTDTAGLRAAEIVLDGPVTLTVASFEDIATALTERFDDDDASPAETGETAVLASARAADDIDSLRDLASGAPVVRAVNDLLEKAVELRASDIHVGPFRSGLEIRMRVDGLLRTVPAPAGVLPQALISRIKILAGLDIAERRLPQDGAARLRLGRDEIDARVAIMPTQHGESAVIRLLPKDRGLLSIDKLGLGATDRATLVRLLALPHGMIVVTGPTGSGKTTTLATILSILNEPTRKILTIEDPVEYEIRGIYQSQVKPAIGLTFAAALRAFVRQDPDVIMVGEVRDPETAHIAVHAALTGHLVLTTLHTDTAAAAVPRLLDLGVEGFLLKSTLRAVIAQRLVRQLCDRCKTARPLTTADIDTDPRYAALGFAAGETVYEPCGCERCGGAGYRGRIGVFEILTLSDQIRELIDRQAGSTALDKAAVAAGMTTMLDDGIAKCRSGMTSPAEVLRVTTVR
ncbi:GspE/PulE family protein [Rhodoplanes roseus]|uniref:General secretion pathway protein GspE n=1 Tax=Rhodoplanes roseus TaxID=29409 RepID=A0A327KZB5_9BRAD|nr:GspE/PulE family protein [Rhodoplanes roseus]RAI43581.1 general secretion pathway protein GspE [Rhodoplanes roseus]